MPGYVVVCVECAFLGKLSGPHVFSSPPCSVSTSFIRPCAWGRGKVVTWSPLVSHLAAHCTILKDYNPTRDSEYAVFVVSSECICNVCSQQ